MTASRTTTTTAAPQKATPASQDAIAQLEGIEPDGEMYDAKVMVLSEYVEHHVKEERNEMFPKVKTWSLDTVKLGTRMAARKKQLMAQVA